MSYSLGKYRVVAELGHGGMADVLLAIVDGPSGTRFTKFAAVKRLRRNLVEEPEFITMLIDEARISARLSHPNVVQTLEVGTENGEYFIALEFLEGQPLHRIQRRADRVGTELSKNFHYAVLLEVLAGLHHAHDLVDYDGTALCIVHRDVTPQNLFVTYDGQVKIVDFGIAKAAGSAGQTQAGLVKGKVRFMSPEQASGRPIDRRTDIFAVGILLWEAATGKRFWQNQDDIAISKAVMAGEYEASPRAVEPTVPVAIDAICQKALAYSPTERYETAAEFRAELEAALDDGLALARRDLGPTVSRLFEKERMALRNVIEQAAKQSRSLHGMPSIIPSLTASMTSGAYNSLIPTPAPSGAQVESFGPIVTNPPPATSIPAEATDKRRPFLAATFGALAVAAAAATVFLLTGESGFAAGDASPRAGRIVTRSSSIFVTSGVTQMHGGASTTSPASFTPGARGGRGVAQPAGPSSGPVAAPTAPTTAAPTAAPAPAPAPTNGGEMGQPRKPRGKLDTTDPW